MKNTLLILCTVLATVYAQLVFKWQAGSMKVGTMDSPGEFVSLCLQMFRPWVMSAFLAQFAGALCWMMALKHVPLTRAYMFVGLTFALVMICGAVLFREALTATRILGCALIIVGVVIGGRG